MRLLVTIPHYFNPAGGGRYGSRRSNPQPRIHALTRCLSAMHQHFGRPQYILQIRSHQADVANESGPNRVDVVICTTGNADLLDQISVPEGMFEHRKTKAEPMLLGYECQEVLRENLGRYDYYAYMEDDLIVHDPLFFDKLRWFNAHVGMQSLLQPNRYEVSIRGLARKLYVDGDIRPQATAAFQDVEQRPRLNGSVMGRKIEFRRALNPHSGCYFLNSEQLAHWNGQSHFCDRDTRFIGPLESAATLGIMRAFRVYKPAPATSNFLEIEHSGTAFLGLVGNKVRLPATGDRGGSGAEP